MVNCFDVSDRSIGMYDSELIAKASLFAHCALDGLVRPAEVVWMNPLPHRFAAWNTLKWIKPKHAMSLFGQIQNFRLIVGRRTDVVQPLCFREIGFAAA